jgi:S-(hydroxymethyl)glutathione dehydrogenase/alcohol dehydrogenase
MPRRAATVVLTSVEVATAKMTVPQVALSIAGREMIEGQYGEVCIHSNLPRVIRMLTDGRLVPEAIITERYQLEGINDGLRVGGVKRDLSGALAP